MNSAPVSTIEIKTKNKYLSAIELITQRNATAESSSIGLKRSSIEGSAAEQEELETAYANLRRQLSVRRVERHAGRAVAVWQKDQQAAEVLRKDGKFESFGYSAQGKLFLEYYEALFLLELNRLQLEYCGMIVSVEQAYVLLLGEAASDKHNNYLVYSALSRAGYIVVKHQTARQAACQAAPTSGDCIWALLEQALSNKPVPTHVKASTNYATAESRWIQLKQQIIDPTKSSKYDQIEPTSEFKFDTRKRRAQSESSEATASKRSCSSKSLVDTLKTDKNYLKFQQTFEKFDIVQLREAAQYENDDIKEGTKRNLKISFDLHLHNEGFRRSAPKSPSFSIIILPANETFPTHNEIVECQRQHMPHAAPLLVISVSESKQIQAFLYYIS